jgi:hypothetical protein
MKRFFALIALILVISIISFLNVPESTTGSAIKSGLFFKEELTEYPAKASVAENKSKVGISADVFHLDFGVLPVGVNSTKILEIKNNDNNKARIFLTSTGNISEMISFGKNDFILEGYEETRVSIKAEARELGDYSGKILITVKKPNFGWLETFL